MKSKYSKITLGGLTGTGKGTISKMLAEKLGFERKSSGDMFREIAEEHGMSMFDFDIRLKNNPEEADKFDILIDKDYTEDYGKTHDNFVFEGRMPAHRIEDAYKILLTCGDSRFERIAERDGISFEQAKEEALGRDAMYTARFDRLYDIKDWDDPKYYDLVIDTTPLTPEQILDKIISEIT